MPSAFIERSFTEILVVVGVLVTVLVVLRLVIGVARRRATQRTDALLKRTLDVTTDRSSGTEPTVE
ncbi:MAG: hypothetical protein CMN30_21360 [Sandaracinus sp.]|nr:hypothetical protein [Sandaracinus sp.]|tara:strand:- start:955 stop:1152 length:198 start_codon:yes stop_codon:yes gene_type:complete